MARARAVEVDGQVEAEPPPEEAGGEGSNSLFDASHDARVRIFRRDERTQKMVTHGYMPPTVSEEDVAERFGGGHYRAQLFLPDPASGIPKVKRSRDFDVPGPYKPPSKILSMEEAGPNAVIAPQQNGAATATMPTVPAGNDLMEVLKAGIINTLFDMMKANREIHTPTMDPMMVEVMKAQAAVQQEIIKQQAEMQKTIVTLMTKEGDTKKDVLGELAKMKELVAPPATAQGDPMAMFNTMLETFTRMRDVAEDINPSRRDGGDPIMDSIPKLVEVVAEQHQMNKQQRQIATRPVPGPAGGVAQMPVVQTIPPAQPEGPPLAMWQQILRQQSARLMASAVAKHDPDVIAGTAILFAPPHVKEALALFFHREPIEVAADIQTEIPAIADHREWLDEFIACAQERLFPDEFTDEGEEDATEAKDGDTGGR